MKKILVVLTLLATCSVVQAKDGVRMQGEVLHCSTLTALKTFFEDVKVRKMSPADAMAKVKPYDDCAVDKIKFTTVKKWGETKLEGQLWSFVEVKEVIIYDPIPGAPFMALMSVPKTSVRHIIFGSPIKGKDA